MLILASFIKLFIQFEAIACAECDEQLDENVFNLLLKFIDFCYCIAANSSQIYFRAFHQ